MVLQFLFEDLGNKVRPPVGEWPDMFARLLPVLGKVVGSDGWPVPQCLNDELQQHGRIDFQQPAGGFGRPLLLLLAPIG